MASSQDITKAEKMYASFIGTLKWAVPVIAVIVAVVVLLIA